MNPGQAQEQSEARHEIWPELDVYIPLNPRFRLILNAASKRASETNQSAEVETGVYLDYFWRKQTTFRTGYHHSRPFDPPTSSENRVSFDQTFDWPLKNELNLAIATGKNFDGFPVTSQAGFVTAQGLNAPLRLHVYEHLPIGFRVSANSSGPKDQ